jgi:hypothetical protein
VLTNVVFWDVTPRVFFLNRRLSFLSVLQLLATANVDPGWLIFFTLMMELIRSS